LALLAKDTAAIFLQDGLMLDNPLGFVTEGKQHLENYAFGAGRVFVDGKQIETWEGSLPRLLYFFVLLQGQVTRAQICQAFWPDLPLDQAVNVFHVTKRRLHKALGVDALQFDGEVYQIAAGYRISLDALRFIEVLLKARQAEGNESRQRYQEVIQAYRAPLLQGAKEAWAKDFRAAFQSAYREALLASARLATDVQAQNSDLDRYRMSLEEAPFNERLQTELLQVYADLGRRDDAVEHYQTLEKAAKEAKQSFSKEFLDFAKSL
jgi:two-component SAPR family response regulator